MSESSIKVSWQFPGESLGPALVSSLDSSSSHQTIGRSTTSSRDQIDGFVLTFAKVAQRQKHGQTKVGPSSLLNSLQSQTNGNNNQPDSEARISQPKVLAPKSNGQPTSFNSGNQYPVSTTLSLDQHQWQAIQLAPRQRSHLLKNLECGTWYAMKIWAFNKVGKGEPSDLVSVSTRGKGK